MYEKIKQKERVNILCLSFYPDAGPSVRHRINTYREAWNKVGAELTIKAFLTEGLYNKRRCFGLKYTIYKAIVFTFCTLRLMLRLRSLKSYDIVIIHREIFPVGPAYFEKYVTKHHPRTIYDIDDAVWIQMPLKIDQRKFWFDPNRVAEIVSTSHSVVTGNQYLYNYASRYNPDSHIIPTPYYDLGGCAVTVETNNPIIVWIGNVGNEEYLGILKTPLEKLTKEFQFTLRIIGNSASTIIDFEGVNIEFKQWCEENEKQWLLESAIGVMPLFDREYEKGKCSFKLIQYFSAGLPVVASPVGMNCKVVAGDKAGECDTGYLAATDQQWYEALKMLLADPALRRSLGRNGYKKYQNDYTPEKNAGKWLDIIEDVL